MSRIVRGWMVRDDFGWVASSDYDLEDETPVTILEHKDGMVGGFEEWMVEYLKDVAEFKDSPTATTIANAIQGLFEEVGDDPHS